MYGLQSYMINKLLKIYFGQGKPNVVKNKLWLGLGLTRTGASQNTEDFDEVSTDINNEKNYKRIRVSFSQAIDGTCFNTNTVMFSTASEDWTTDVRKIESVGIFDTDKFFSDENESESESRENETDEHLIKPLFVWRLSNPAELKKGETIIIDPSLIVINLRV